MYLNRYFYCGTTADALDCGHWRTRGGVPIGRLAMAGHHGVRRGSLYADV